MDRLAERSVCRARAVVGQVIPGGPSASSRVHSTARNLRANRDCLTGKEVVVGLGKRSHRMAFGIAITMDRHVTMTIVQTENLTKVYGKGEAAVTALDGVDVSISSGEFVAVMGPSGCGKSTLLHLIGGLDRPTSGRVLLDSSDLATLDDTKLTEVRRRQSARA